MPEPAPRAAATIRTPHRRPALSVLYLGDGRDHTGSAAMARALERMGHDVTLVDPAASGPRARVAQALDYRTGYRLTRGRTARAVMEAIGGRRFDLVWVSSGEQVSPALVRRLRERSRYVVNHNMDDPFGDRDGRRFDTYRAAVPDYDLLVVVRDENVAEARGAGAKDVLKVWRTFDDDRHVPRPVGPAERERWASQVMFVGTYMPERGPFMARLLELGVPLSIWGDGWDRAPEWPTIREAWRGPAIYGADYAMAVECATVGLGLLSKGNRDLHTTRSLEIPAIGGLLCAERTSEHAALYREGVEAVFWADADECARVCHELVLDPERARRIAVAGHQRVIDLGLSHAGLVESVLDRLAL